MLRSFRVLAFLLGAWGLAAFATASVATADPAPAERFELRLTTPELRAERRPDGFSEIGLEGFASQGRRPGVPSLPLRALLVAIPPGVVPSLEVRLPGETLLLPGVVPRPVPRIEVQLSEGASRELIQADRSPHERSRVLSEATRQVVEPDPAVYGGDALFPAEPARLGRTGVLRDQRYVEVLISPVRYDPATGGLRVHSAVEVIVHFEGYEEPPGRARDERHFEPIYETSLANPYQGRQFRLSAYEKPAPREPGGARAERAGLGKGGTAPRYRIVVRRDGMVRLDHARLQSAPDLLATGVATWRLTRGGETIPLVIRDDGDGTIEAGEWVAFYGQAYDDDPKTVLNDATPPGLYEAGDFTDETHYFLTVEAPAQAEPAEVDATPAGRTPPASFQDVARIEVDDAYRPLGGEDPWYWLPTLVTTGESPATRVEPVPVPGLYDPAAPVEVTALVRGTSTRNADPDHLIRLRLRNQDGLILESQDGAFDGLSLFAQDLVWNHDGSGPVASDPLLVELEVLPTGFGRNDVIADYFEVRYDRAFRAIDDILEFGWPDEDAEFVVTDLSTSDVDVFDGTPDAATGIVTLRRLTGATLSGAGPYDVRFRIDDDPGLPPGTLRRLVVVGAGSGAVPADEDFVADTVSTLRDTSKQADLIVVAHPDLLDAGPGSVLNQLLHYKTSVSGGEITSSIAVLTDIYDEFNGGQPGPWAIREFLRWVLSTAPGEGWADPKPAFVMLLGDGSIDYKGGPAEGNFVPTQVLFKDDPQLGYYASDNLLAAVVGDDQAPDLVVGRLPGRSVEQLNLVLRKTLDYTVTPDLSGNWRERFLLISDRGDSSGDGNLAFEATNARIESLICSGGASTLTGACPGNTSFLTTHLRYYTDYYTNPELLNPPGRMSVDLKAAVNGEDGVGNGASVLQYNGHGNFVVWSGDAFFDQRPPPPPGTVDTEELFNGQRLPWLMAHNCLTGGFHITEASTMGEDWLHREGGGAIGVFSPTGLSFDYVGRQVGEFVWQSLLGRRKERNIAVPVFGALSTLCAQGSVEPCQNYALLGDPTLRLNLRSVEPAADVLALAGHQRVDVSWAPSATPGVTYDIYRKREFFLYQKLNAAPLSATQFTDTGLVNAQNYLYYVVAVDPDGFESRWSNFNEDCSPGSPDCVKATPLNPDAPSTPTGLTASDPGLGNRLSLRWNPNPEDDLAYYTIYYGTEPGNYTTVQDVGLLTQVDVSGLAEGATVYFAVSASNTSSRTSPRSNEVSDFPIFAPGLRPPAYVEGLRVDRSGSDLLLEWDEVSSDAYGKPTQVVAYEILRGTGYRNESLAKIGECAAPCGTFVDPGAAAAPGERQYRVRALDTAGLAGSLGAEFPRGTVLSLLRSPTVPGNITLSWLPVVSTVTGAPTTGIVYRVLGADAPFTLSAARSGEVGVLATTTETSFDDMPWTDSRYYSVLAVDEKGNVSPF